MTIDEKRLAEIRGCVERDEELVVPTGYARDLLAMLDAMRDESTGMERELAEVGRYADAVGTGLALADMPLSFVAVPESMRMQATGLVGAAASIMRREIVENPDPERRNSWMIKIFFGESDEAWQLSMRREGSDTDYGLLMQQQRDAARGERNAALRRAEDAERKLAALHAAARAFRADVVDQIGEEAPSSLGSLSNALGDVAPVAERHDREVADREWHKFLRLLSEAGLTVPGKVGKSGPRFESGAQEAEDFSWARVAIGGRIDAFEREVRVKELRRMAVVRPDAASWLRDEADRIERGEA